MCTCANVCMCASKANNALPRPETRDPTDHRRLHRRLHPRLHRRLHRRLVRNHLQRRRTVYQHITNMNAIKTANPCRAHTQHTKTGPATIQSTCAFRCPGVSRIKAAQRHSGAASQRRSVTASQRHSATAAQRHSGTAAQRHRTVRHAAAKQSGMQLQNSQACSRADAPTPPTPPTPRTHSPRRRIPASRPEAGGDVKP